MNQKKLRNPFFGALLLGLLVCSLEVQAYEVKDISCPANASYPVHLTFDDGPHNPNTLKVLDTLKRRGIKATFLISASHFPSLAKIPPGTPGASEKQMMGMIAQMQAEGHTVGSHSYDHITHADLRHASAEQIEDTLQKNVRVLKGLGLPTTIPFRFPQGSGWFNELDPANQAQGKKVMAQIKAWGFTPLHWDIDSWDWSKIKRKALPDSMLHQVCTHEGGVILMHDIQPTTADQLDTLIDSLQLSGHKIVSFSDIKKYSAKHPRAAFADKTAGIFYCRRSVGELDAVWPTCSDYERKSYDLKSSGGAQ